MARKGSVAVEVKENDPVADSNEKDVEDKVDKVAPTKKGSRKGKATAGKKTVKILGKEEPIEEEADEAVNEERGEGSAEETEQDANEAPVQKPKRGAKKAEEVKAKEEKKMPAKKVNMVRVVVEPVATESTEASAGEDEIVPEDPVVKGKGGRKAPAAAAKGRKGKKTEETEKDEAAMEEDKEEEEAKEAAPKGRAGKKAAVVEPVEEEDEQKEEEEEVAPAPKMGRKAAAKTTEDEPETKKAKKDEKPAAKGKGKKAVLIVEEEKEEEEEEEVQEKPKGRGRAAKKADVKEEEKEEKEEEEKPAGRPKRGAATKAAAAAAAAKKQAEEDEEVEEEMKPKKTKAASKKTAKKEESDEEEEKDEEVKPKKGAKAAPKKTAKKEESDEEEEKPTPAKARGGKQPAKGRGKGKKAEAAGDDEDGPTSSKKPKVEDDDDATDGMNEGKSMTKSIRRVEVKGKAAVDPLCTRKASNSHVYEDGDLIYDVMLNQTNIGNNNNKFYVIQLLEEDARHCYSVWMRWGRVGYDGQNKLVECGDNLQMAIKEFASKFEAKTKNEWPTAFADFQTYSNKYTMIEMDYGNGGSGSDSGDAKIEQEQEEEEKKCEEKQVVSKLDDRVQQLMHLMCSIRTMAQAVKQLEFDADKSPLGKLTQHQIKEGFSCLGRIEKFIEKKDFGAEFKLAVNEYYTKVPHACGFRPPAMIKTPQLLKQEIELLDLLSGIEYAIKTMKQETREEDVHPVDRHYASLHCGLAPMEKDEEEYKLVAEYLSKTHGSTHNIQMGLKNVFRVERDGEDSNEELMEKIGNRKLLWHGSRLSNFFGILSQGLRIAPPEAPCTGYMFGKGVYFADMASKSGNYCFPSEDGQTGFLLLAEVALGEEHRLRQADYNANKLPKGKSSTWGLGKTMPDPAQNKQLNDKVVVPCGPPVANSLVADGSANLLYNEFIVYDTQQIRMRYLLEVEFTML